MYRIIILICIVVSVAWCSSSDLAISDDQTITFDRYMLKWSSDYIPSDPVSVDNQQIINQILAVYQSAGDQFSKNLIISTSKVKQWLDGMQFMTLNADKIQSEIAGLVSDGYQEITIECDDQEIPAYIHQLHHNPRQSQETHSMLQLYRVADDQWYIASVYTNQSDDLDQYKKYFKSLTCK